MARPKAKELTERELEIMHLFWDLDPEEPADQTAQQIRDALSLSGRDLAYTTVATLIRILNEKGFLTMTHNERPFRYQAARSFDDVSGSLLHDLVNRVFGGSREMLLVRLTDQKKLTAKERAKLEEILQQQHGKRDKS